MSDIDPAELLADTLKREGDRESSLQPYRDKYWLPIAQRVTAEGWTSPAEAAALRARIDELEARTPATLDPDSIADEFGIQGLGIEGGIATLTTTPTTEQSRALVLTMSLACGKMLDDDQATNYVEFEVSPANHAGYVVHVRRAHRPSPHDLRKAADARAAELEAQLAAARTAIDKVQEAHEKQLTRLAKERAKLSRKVDRLRAKVSAIRELADRWAETPNDYDEDTEQRIEDGWALRVLVDSEELFDLDELPARTLRLRRMAEADRLGVPFNEADYVDAG